MQFFKVYVDGKSPYTKTSMPKIGKWTKKTEPIMCLSGWHVTTRPDLYRNDKWKNIQIYLVEGKGKMKINGDKISFESIRLIKEITPDWEYLDVFPYVKAVVVSKWKMLHKDELLPSWADLSFSNLSNAYLSNADLSFSNLSNAYLSNADLSNADLSFSNLSNAYLSNADLSFSNLSNADLSCANLSNADLSNAYLSNADLSFSNLSNADLSFSNLSNADLSNADLSNVNFSNAYLSNADLSCANLSNADLSNAEFSGAHGIKDNLLFSNEQREQSHC